MKKYLLLPIAAFVLFNCSENQEKMPESVTSHNDDHTKVKGNVAVASIFPETNHLTSPKKALDESRKQELIKTLSLPKLFAQNISFTENKGQLENYHNVHLAELGKVRYYTKAFGGTAYFTESGVGIGFLRGKMEKDWINKHEEEEKEEGESEEDEKREELEKMEKGFYENIGFNIHFLNRNPELKVVGEGEGITKLNYIKGNDPSKYATDIANYNAVVYKQLYKGVDLKYYLHDQQLIFEYKVQPTGNVKDIRLKYSGVNGLKVNSAGELEITMEWGVLKDKNLYSYQIINGVKKEVDVRYKVYGKDQVGFVVNGSYDKSKELIIDPPTLSWSTFVNAGVVGDDAYFEDLAMDNDGDLYGTGWVHSGVFPGTVNTYKGAVVTSDVDVIVFKLNSTGTTLLYGTFIGGTDGGGGLESGFGIDVSSAEEAYVVGRTSATNFPMVSAHDNTHNGGSDIIALRLNAAGNTLLYSTYYGGTGDEGAYDVVLNGTNDSYLTGYTNSSGLGTGGSVYSAGYDSYVLKFNSTGVRQFFTYYGGSGDDNAKGIDIDGSGNVFIAGMTTSNNIPSTAGRYKAAISAGTDAYIAKISSAGAIQYATYFGGLNPDMASAVRVAYNGDVVVGGVTDGPSLTTLKAVQAASVAGIESYFACLDNALTNLVYSTYVAGSAPDGDKGWVMSPGEYHKPVGLDVVGDQVLFATVTGSNNMLMSSAYDNSQNGAYDYYIGVYDYDGTTLTQQFGTYMGGTANDYPTAGIVFDRSSPAGCFYVGGSTHSNNFPVTAGTFQTVSATGNDQSNIAKFCFPEILPVNFLTFTVNKGNYGTALLNWATASEENNSHFIVEKSYDGKNFFPIGTVKGAGTTSQVTEYSFVDDAFTASAYYRLKQYDFDGQYACSHIRFLLLEKGAISVFPNPANDFINISSEIYSDGMISIEIINELGQIVLTMEEEVNSGIYTRLLSVANFPDGVYVFRMSTADGSYNQKLIIE